MINFFLKAKKMRGYIIGTLGKPMNENDEKYEEVNNLKIITLINNSIDNLIGIKLAKYETVKEI